MHGDSISESSVRFEVNGQSGNNRPSDRILIDNWPLDEFRQSVADLPFGDEVASLVEETYRPGVSMGEACRRMLERLLKPYGFLFLDPLHPTTENLLLRCCAARSRSARI